MALYLTKRGGRYHLRLRVPSDLVTLFGRHELHRSLGAVDHRTAKRRATSLVGRMVEGFADLRYRRALGALLDDLCQAAGLLSAERLPRVRRRRDVPTLRNRQPFKLSEATDRFIEDRRSRWQAKTVLMQRGALDLFIQVVGDKLLTSVTREDCRRFQDTVKRLPPNMSKRFKGKTIDEVLTLGQPAMAPKNANRILSFLSSFMNWCVREGYLSRSPAKGLLLPINQRADGERAVFASEDLQRLFNRLQPSDGARYWLPLIALHSGLRLEEIAQLETTDLCEVDSVQVFWVNGHNAKRLKTPQSERYVPVHSHLITAGLLGYRDQLSPGRLWPMLERGADGTYSSAFSKWFGRFKTKAGVTSRRVVFHSFRHTFIDALKQAGVDELVVKELVGHVNESITTGRYGKRYSPAVTAPHVNRLVFLASPVHDTAQKGLGTRTESLEVLRFPQTPPVFEITVRG